MGTLIRLALMAGTGAGIAGLRRAGRKLALCLIAGVAIALLLAAAIGWLGFAVFYAIALSLGPIWAAALVALGFAVIALIVALCCRRWSGGRTYEERPTAAEAAAPIGAVAGLEALQGLSRVLERNALSVLLAAFVAGMVMNRRR
ncbi:MAG TPA: hypothetical protein VMW18_06520 [Candidatus Binatia bacterium]|nr:hypothetical protein [Candidatus Binatia bacterium]